MEVIVDLQDVYEVISDIEFLEYLLTKVGSTYSAYWILNTLLTALNDEQEKIDNK